MTKKISKIVNTKHGKYEISYKGDRSLDRDTFVFKFSGYDHAIGNEIVGEYDFANFPECNNDPKFLELIKIHNEDGFSSLCYHNSEDIINTYVKCFEAIKPLEEASFLSWIEEYNNRINGYKFFIEKIE